MADACLLPSQGLGLQRLQKSLPLPESEKGSGQDVFQRRHDPQELSGGSAMGAEKSGRARSSGHLLCLYMFMK